MTDGDTGRTSPNAIVSYHIRKHGNEVFSSAVRSCGFPYKWVQNICGISDDVELPDSATYQQQANISAKHIESVVSRLRNRFRSQVYLISQIVSLSSGKYSLLLFCTWAIEECIISIEIHDRGVLCPFGLSEEHKMVTGPEMKCTVSTGVNCKLSKWQQLLPSDVQASLFLADHYETLQTCFCRTFLVNLLVSLYSISKKGWTSFIKDSLSIRKVTKKRYGSI